MSDEPRIGLVIRHLYLWRDGARQGREEGSKARPCVIIRTHENETKETEVYIAPITHTPPLGLKQAIEIPQATKNRLNLDYEKSWIITSEVNRFYVERARRAAHPNRSIFLRVFTAGVDQGDDRAGPRPFPKSRFICSEEG